jgi:hypothetical protein
MLFGYDKNIQNTKTSSAVYVCPVDGKTVVNQSKRPLLNLVLKDGTYLANKVVQMVKSVWYHRS